MHPIDRRSLLSTGFAAGALAATPVLAPAFAQSQAQSPAGVALRTSSVATPDFPSAIVGADILRRGGNAVDAAVAIGLALAVTYPEAGNIGGGGFMTGYSDGRPWFLDYRETAPAAARETMYQGPDGQVIDGLSLVGNLAAGVPGTVRGLWEAHQRHGRMRWRDVVRPAVDLAANGFEVPEQMVRIMRDAQRDLGGADRLGGSFGTLAAGQTFRQPDLARTLDIIARRGADGFYRGEVARLIEAQMQRGEPRGLITRADLAAYRARWREPILGSWNGMQVISAPPPSSGGIALMQLLQMKAARADLFRGVTHNSAQYIHLMAELSKRVFADRAQYLGDPDFTEVPVAALIDPAYAARRAADVDPARPSPTPAIQPGLERPQTTHYSVVDADGNAVSNTYTINGWYGSGVVVEGAGFLLNNEMDDFSAAPGVPNQFGVVGGRANAIAPGKRPLSSMTPTLLTRDGRVVLAVGSPGGSRIITTVFQMIANVFDFGMSLEDAVKAQRFHHQLLPENTIFTEPFDGGLDAGVRADLEGRGYRFEMQDYVGDVAAILSPAPGELVTAPDPRARGHGLSVYTMGG